MTLLQTGRTLDTYNSTELFAVASYLLLEVASKRTKEEAEAREKAISRVRRIDREAETGMPAVTELYKSADQLYGEGV